MSASNGRGIEIDELRLKRAAKRDVDGFELGPVSLRIGSGARVAIVGPSGCGKTTLLRVLAGFERPEVGKVKLGERVVVTEGMSEPPEARRVGFVFQDAALWSHLDVDGHLKFVAPTVSKSDRHSWIQRVGLEHRRKAKPAELSGGERQRLALARALITEPDVLLLDEPLASVDVHLREELGLVIRDLAVEEGVTVVLVTHDRDEALAIADEVVVMEDGRIVESGSASESLTNPKTAFAASFLAGAALFELEVAGPGSVRSPFGEHEAEDASSAGYRLAVLPGDLIEAPTGIPAEVVTVRRDAFGRSLVVGRVAGQPVHFLSESNPTSGSEVRLGLRNPARILPLGRSEPRVNPLSGSVASDHGDRR
ncbi:MAG: ABC transporter ATP-binding protein [Planctomycetota bacterium]